MNLLRVVAVLLTLGVPQNLPSGSIAGILRTPGGAPAAAMRVAAMPVPGDGQPVNEICSFVIASMTPNADRSGPLLVPSHPALSLSLMAGKTAGQIVIWLQIYDSRKI